MRVATRYLIVVLIMAQGISVLGQQGKNLVDHNGVSLDASVTDPKLSEKERQTMIEAARNPEPSRTTFDPLEDDASLHDLKLSPQQRKRMLEAVMRTEPSHTDYDPLKDDMSLTDPRAPHNNPIEFPVLNRVDKQEKVEAGHPLEFPQEKPAEPHLHSSGRKGTPGPVEQMKGEDPVNGNIERIKYPETNEQKKPQVD